MLNIGQPKHCCVAQDTSVPIPNSTAADSSLPKPNGTAGNSSLHDTAHRISLACPAYTKLHSERPRPTVTALDGTRPHLTSSFRHYANPDSAIAIPKTTQLRLILPHNAITLRCLTSLHNAITIWHIVWLHFAVALQHLVPPRFAVALRHLASVHFAIALFYHASPYFAIASPYFAPPLLYTLRVLSLPHRCSIAQVLALP